MTDPQKSPDERPLIEAGLDESSKLECRIKRYSSARKRAKAMLSHLRITDQLKPERAALSQCGNYLLFRQYYTVGKVRLAAAHSCKKHLLCPLCAIRRGAKSLKAYLDRLAVIQRDRPALRPYLVTLTIANGDDLAERQRHLANAVKRYHQTRRNVLKGVRSQATEVCKAEGAVWTFEVTNRGRGWHPHAHAIWLCETPPDADQLAVEWKATTGDSHVVDVRPIQGDPADGFCEVFKYAMKFSELDLAHNVEAYETLRGKRLLGSFGCFRGVAVPAELTDELLEDLPYIEILYTYRDAAGYGVASVSDPVNPSGAAAAAG